MKEILITAGDMQIKAQLNDSPTAQEILKMLPITSRVQLWGEEIYFPIPLEASLEPDAQQDVEVGSLGYWPVDQAFCIFFGPTPASPGTKPRAYSPVNIVGKIIQDTAPLKNVPEGAQITIIPL
jgi:uncharacterized protein